MVTLQDLFDFLSSWFGGNADYNHNGATSLQDLFDFLADWFAGCTLGPTITVTPSSAGLGTVLTITAASPTAPYLFDSGTTAMWSGRYIPNSGTPSDAFDIEFSAAEFVESSSSQAQIVLGTGTGAFPSGIEGMGPGVFQGTFNIVYSGGATALTQFTLTPQASTQTWRQISYPNGAGALTPPQLGSSVSQCTIYALSLSPNQDNPTVQQLNSASDLHHAIELLVEQNSASSAVAPSQMTLDLVSFDESGFEVGRAPVVLSRIDADNDSAHITYRSSLDTPIIFVDVETTAPSGFVVLPASPLGKVTLSQHQ